MSEKIDFNCGNPSFYHLKCGKKICNNCWGDHYGNTIPGYDELSKLVANYGNNYVSYYFYSFWRLKNGNYLVFNILDKSTMLFEDKNLLSVLEKRLYDHVNSLPF